MQHMTDIYTLSLHDALPICPAAGLAVIVADSILVLGTNAAGEFDMAVGFQTFLVPGVIAGILQIILAVLKAGIIRSEECRVGKECILRELLTIEREC